jgi:hypothetical protein
MSPPTEHKDPAPRLQKARISESGSKKSSLAARHREERRRQVRGLVLLALAILAFSLLRAHPRTVFTPNWWRLW